VLIHGYPLNGHSWERQEAVLLAAGHRVITYDRRGFGRPASRLPATTTTPSPPISTPAHHLDLQTSCWPASRWAPARSPATSAPTARDGWQGRIVRRDPAIPAQDRRQPRGRGRSVFDGIKRRSSPTVRYFKDFFDNFYNIDTYAGRASATRHWRQLQRRGPVRRHGQLACVDTWLTDFPQRPAKIDATLLVHGDADRILPIDAPSKAARLIRTDVVEVPGGPRQHRWTHADEVNRALLDSEIVPHGHVTPGSPDGAGQQCRPAAGST